MSDLISREEVLKRFNEAEPLVRNEHDNLGMIEHAMWAGLCEIVKEISAVKEK